MSQWSNLQRSAKDVEANLQINIDRFSSIVQKANEDYTSSYGYDEEHGSLLNSENEERLIKQIEVGLLELMECIQHMKEYNNNNNNSNSHSNLNGISSGSNSRMNDELIKRYNEIYFDFNNEFKSLSVS